MADSLAGYWRRVVARLNMNNQQPVSGWSYSKGDELLNQQNGILLEEVNRVVEKGKE